MTKLVVVEEDRCTCDEEEIEPHPCPYSEEMNEDSDWLCQCCRYCRIRCAEEI